MQSLCQLVKARNKDQHCIAWFSPLSIKRHGTSDCRFTFGKNFARDLKSVFGPPIEIWLAIGANMGEGEFLASNSGAGEILGEKAVHVEIYVDSFRNFCPCESLKCPEEGSLTWLLAQLHLVRHYLYGSTVFLAHPDAKLVMRKWQKIWKQTTNLQNDSRCRSK